MSSGALRGLPRRRVGVLDFTVLPLEQAIELIDGLRATDRGIAVHFANAYNIALAGDDATYRALMQRGDLVFTDGMPVVWAGRRLHADVASQWTRVYGPDVMVGVLDAAACGDRETSDPTLHYLLGGSPETLDRLRATIAFRWPYARIVGAESPPFRPWTDAELTERAARIAASGATHVWVGLGTPKQDIEVRRLADSLPVVALAVGAAFDFIAGTVEQAPAWMQRSGLEWTYRLAREPRRLAKRYLWGNPKFVAAVAKQAAWSRHD